VTLRSTRSISRPIVIAGGAAALTVALGIGWTFVLGENLSLTRDAVPYSWLLGAGMASFVVIVSALAILCVFLVREILESRRQERFIDSVTHELKSPLASIKLCLETLGREGLPAERKDGLREMMLEDVERLSSFIDDVLEASRLSLGRRPWQIADVAVLDLAARCADRVIRRHKLGPEAIALDVPAGLSVRTDPTALEAVLGNLLDNAVKYSDDPVVVRLSAAEDPGGGVLLAVSDQGIGLPAKYVGRVFERFFRVPTEAVRTRKGTGLGLFVVASLVRELGGRIEARSDGPGAGAEFRVTLPATV
jgi:signal transduction histidine kinase